MVGSPRTPHVSQINVKRQKHVSQLSRPMIRQPSFTDDENAGKSEACASKPKLSDDGFAVPVRIPTKSKSFHVSQSGHHKADAEDVSAGTKTELARPFQIPSALSPSLSQQALHKELELLRSKLKKGISWYIRIYKHAYVLCLHGRNGTAYRAGNQAGSRNQGAFASTDGIPARRGRIGRTSPGAELIRKANIGGSVLLSSWSKIKINMILSYS